MNKNKRPKRVVCLELAYWTEKGFVCDKCGLFIPAKIVPPHVSQFEGLLHDRPLRPVVR